VEKVSIDWKKLSGVVLRDLEVWGHSVREIQGGSVEGGGRLKKATPSFRWTKEEVSLRKLRGFWWEHRRWFLCREGGEDVVVVWARYDELSGMVEGGVGVLK
jgi:hypothetical protein